MYGHSAAVFVSPLRSDRPNARVMINSPEIVTRCTNHIQITCYRSVVLPFVLHVKLQFAETSDDL